MQGPAAQIVEHLLDLRFLFMPLDGLTHRTTSPRPTSCSNSGEQIQLFQNG